MSHSTCVVSIPRMSSRAINRYLNKSDANIAKKALTAKYFMNLVGGKWLF